MLKSLELLEKSRIIKSYEILDFKSGRDFYYPKAKATLIDDSILFFREFVSPDDVSYSYNWMDRKSAAFIFFLFSALESFSCTLSTFSSNRFLRNSNQKLMISNKLSNEKQWHERRFGLEMSLE